MRPHGSVLAGARRLSHFQGHAQRGFRHFLRGPNGGNNLRRGGVKLSDFAITATAGVLAGAAAVLAFEELCWGAEHKDVEFRFG